MPSKLLQGAQEKDKQWDNGINSTLIRIINIVNNQLVNAIQSLTRLLRAESRRRKTAFRECMQPINCNHNRDLFIAKLTQTQNANSNSSEWIIMYRYICYELANNKKRMIIISRKQKEKGGDFNLFWRVWEVGIVFPNPNERKGARDKIGTKIQGQ